MAKSIELKLQADICPFLVSARHLTKKWPYRLYVGYSYVGEMFVLLAGFGLANPVMAFLSGGQSTAEPAQWQGSSTIVEFLSSQELGLVSLALLLVWGLVKFYVRREDLEKRSSLVTSYIRQCSQMELGVRRALSNEDPMPELLALQAKLGDLVDRHIAEGTIEGTGIDSSLKMHTSAYCKDLIDEYSAHWKLPPAVERRQPTLE